MKKDGENSALSIKGKQTPEQNGAISHQIRIAMRKCKVYSGGNEISHPNISVAQYAARQLNDKINTKE